MFKVLKKLDKKTLIYLGIGVGMVLLLLIILLVLKLSVHHKISSNEFELRVKTAAIEYYKKYPDKLPKNDSLNVSVDIKELVTDGVLKDPDSLLESNVTCDGKVNVTNNNGYYLYQPIIECSDEYKTTLLYQKVLENNPIKQSGNGLYQVNDYYLFRGESLNNYVSFADKKWYILRINNDNTLRLIMINDFNTPIVWDNRYNSEAKANYGKNNFMISRMKESLEYYYTNMFTDDQKALIVPKELCIGARSEADTSLNDKAECSKKTEKLPVGLLQVHEYPIVSLDPECKGIYNLQCTNYNYLTTLSTYWSINASADDSYKVYVISGVPQARNASNTSQAKLVINISANALFNGGDGTEENPYIIK